MANKSGGASKTGQASNYKTLKLWERNRLRKLNKQLKLQPNNEKQIKAAMSAVRYRRKTPTAPFWSKTRIKIAGLFKAFEGRVNLEMFNNNEKISVPATLSWGPYKDHKAPSVNEKTMFQLGTRAHHGGVPVWS